MKDHSSYEYVLQQYIDGNWVTLATLDKKSVFEVCEVLRGAKLGETLSIYENQSKIVVCVLCLNHGPLKITKVGE